MATRSVKLPDIGEGVAEAEVVEWHVKVGDAVREDQVLAAVMTDKATVEIPSPADGTVTALGVAAGTVLAVGSELVRLEVGGGTPEAPNEPVADGLAAPEAPPPPRPPEAPVLAPAEVPPRPLPSPPPSLRGPPPRPVPAGMARAAGEKPLAAPAVRRRALEAGIDLRQVRGTGPAGRITHDDLDAVARADAAPTPAAGSRERTGVEDVAVRGLRRRIARAMAESTRRVAHFSYVEEVDVTALEELRAALNRRHGAARPKLTLIPFLVQALVRALPDFPGLNAHYDDEAEVVHRFGAVHVGIAAQTAGGLVVPVLRHAEARDLWNCAAEVRRLAEAARDGTAARDELSGSTITVTSLGALGGIASTPVVNRPEVAIVGVNRQVMRPMWIGGGVVPRLMMNLSSSFDHRVVDGHEAASFIQAVKALLETPALLFMEA
ncbi:dihydrolipoamide acetyltransferase family protein [Lichenibacterium ramalinae]|uniref:Dihydrolipoamide acetyltransferase component of pyruvate dehydrogenase complex n=1 Tax=Lichenibacterium ramalinae TaxID=2316527 RepID=A0A4Q2RGI0_9HYPH|nr:dihydrolipoamide acetyltransferase family protein [Lichenibacterium ramalinae]RYB06683.1 2-oxo acid dehydrogenase subunit E2 [Lichenibacterium ramalinae]